MKDMLLTVTVPGGFLLWEEIAIRDNDNNDEVTRFDRFIQRLHFRLTLFGPRKLIHEVHNGEGADGSSYCLHRYCVRMSGP